MSMSIISGKVITRTGRYKAWPIGGMAVATVGMYLLARMDAGTGRIESSIAMAVLGAGIGRVMQVLVLAVQNAADYRDLGVATSATNFFRSMGGSLGVAVFGAVLAARSASELARRLPADAASRLGSAAGKLDEIANSPEHIRQLPVDIQHAIVGAIAAAVHAVFIWAIPLLVIGFVLSWFLKEIPLKDTAHTGGSVPMEL
jgi:hypothetical protein